MYYIRLLKPPKMNAYLNDKSPKNAFPRLTTKITIATDLGDSFLCENLQLTAMLLLDIPEAGWARDHTFLWKGAEGMRAMEIQIPLLAQMPRSRVKQKFQLWIRPTKGEITVETFEDVLDGRSGVIPVGSAWMDVSAGIAEEDPPDLMGRVLLTNDGRKVFIWEEMRESIARHVWDAGLVLSALIAHILCPKLSVSSLDSHADALRLPYFSRFLHTVNSEDICNRQPLQVLELGAGCGIVALTFLSCLNAGASPTRILLTDLPAASELLATNITSCTHKNPQVPGNLPIITHMVLDWSAPLPTAVSATAWDVIFVADCTYNPDVVPDLVMTLGKIESQTRILKDLSAPNYLISDKKIMVIVALKERHESERVFFDLMASNRWLVLEQCNIPLPMAMSSDEEIRIFVFVPSHAT